MSQDTKVELVAKEVFDVEETLLTGQVYFEPLKNRMPRRSDPDWMPRDEFWEPESFSDVRKQLESIAQCFGVEHVPPDQEKVRASLTSLVEEADACGLTLVIIGSTFEPWVQENPLIPGIVALFSEWPTVSSPEVLWDKPKGARMVHWTTCSYDPGHIVIDLFALWGEFTGMGEEGCDPMVSQMLDCYPACA